MAKAKPEPIPKHDKKDVNKALQPLRDDGWLAHYPGGHCWAQIMCPYDDYCGPFSVNGSPRSEGNEAKRITRWHDKCSGVPRKAAKDDKGSAGS
jgi:hypothetical protein